MQKYEEVLEQLKKMKPKALILFGSAASGKIKKDSDLDILMVKETKKSFSDRIGDTRCKIKTNLALDIIVVTPKEINKLYKEDEFFSQIVNEGNLIYGKI